MAPRSGMYKLLDQLRTMASAGQDDYQIGNKWYWDDDDLQVILDRYRTDVFGEELQSRSILSGGSTIYLDYYSQRGNYERTTGGTAVFYLRDGSGNTIGTASYTPDYERGAITFAANTSGTVYYLYGRAYDLNKSAAEVWRQKAAYYAKQFNFSTDNHRMELGSVYKHCIEMAQFYEQKTATLNVVTLWRSDVDAHPD